MSAGAAAIGRVFWAIAVPDTYSLLGTPKCFIVSVTFVGIEQSRY